MGEKKKNQGGLPLRFHFFFLTDTKLKEKYLFHQGQAFGLNFSDGTEYR